MQPTKTNIQLWEDFRKGEKYALPKIYNLYVEQLFRYGKKFTVDDELIKDAIQDLFFDLIRTRSNLGQTNHISFYLIKAFRRRLFRSISNSKNKKLRDKGADAKESEVIYSMEEDWIQKEQLSRKEEIIRKAMSNLSAKQREIIYYRYTCDFEYDQICEIMSIKYDSARKMVFRALQTLREHFSDTSVSLFTALFQKNSPFG